MAINAVWHKAHKMPKNPRAKERLKWHLAHAKACGCRPLTKEILVKLRKGAATN